MVSVTLEPHSSIVGSTRLLHRQEQRSFYWVVCLVALATLIFAQSRSPFTGALLGLLTVFILARRFDLLVLIALASAILVTATAAIGTLQQAFLRGQDPQMFHSLSGRVSWWSSAWRLVPENPLFGLGGWAAGRFAVLGPLGASDTSSLHNAWLEMLIGVGLIGLFPFVVTFVRTWVNLLGPFDALWPGEPPNTANELRIEATGIFVLLCFRSIFTAQFIWHPPELFFLVLGYAELRRRRRAGNPAFALHRTYEIRASRGPFPRSSVDSMKGVRRGHTPGP